MNDSNRINSDKQVTAIEAVLVLLSWLVYLFLTVGALITHAYVAWQSGSISFLVVPIVIFPLGTVFGWMTWFDWLVYTF